MFSALFQPKFKLCTLCPDGMDMHSHLLWGVDDGARTQAESLELISLLKKRGIPGSLLHSPCHQPLSLEYGNEFKSTLSGACERRAGRGF